MITKAFIFLLLGSELFMVYMAIFQQLVNNHDIDASCLYILTNPATTHVTLNRQFVALYKNSI